MRRELLQGDCVQLRISSSARQNIFFFFLNLLCVSYSIYRFFVVFFLALNGLFHVTKELVAEQINPHFPGY